MMQHLLQGSPILEKLRHWRHVMSFNEIQLTTSQKVVLWSLGVVGTSAVVVGVLSKYLARKRAKPIMNPRIQRALNKRMSRMRSPSGGMGSVASSGGRSSPTGFSERLSLASGSIGSGGGDAAPLSPQQLGVMGTMAPPKKFAPKQLELLLNCMEKNKDMAYCKSIGPSEPINKSILRQKWSLLAKRLNSVPDAPIKTPEIWRKFWCLWRYKCRKKAENLIRFPPPKKGPCRFTPLDNLEKRGLELTGFKVPIHITEEHRVGSHFMDDLEVVPDCTLMRWEYVSESEEDTKKDIVETKANSPTTYVKIKAKPKTSMVYVNNGGGEARTWPSQNAEDELDIKTSPSTPKRNSSASGMEALETSINYWEDALAAFSLGARGGVTGTLALTSPEEAEFCREIQDLLQNAYMLQERCELLFLDQRSVLFRSESGGAAGAGAGAAETGEGRRSRLLSTHTVSSHTRREHHSSADSFASAEDQVADLREFDDFTEITAEIESFELYQNALKQLEAGIPYRTLRTEVVQCGSDAEFLVKLHCLRQAFQQLFRDAAVWEWFVDAGRQVLTDLLLFADKEPKEFLVAYEEMVSWATDGSNWSTIETELTTKGVKALTFYDVVLDYILLDAFEDLAAPPSSVLAVVRNRWLSDGFKESALTTAVWSVIKAKRRYLQYPEGFMAHFYSISEHLLPVLVWGFLGPRERLRDVCQCFQSEIVGFIADLFSFHKCRYTNLEDLASDIMQHAKSRAANITDKLADRV